MFLLWPFAMLILGIKKLVLLILGVHSVVIWFFAILLLFFFLAWEFKKKRRSLSYNLDSPFEPSVMPGIWMLVSAVIPEIRHAQLPEGTTKIGKICWN